jgi:LPPG:FO 2-phospho-L-lactate transferase
MAQVARLGGPDWFKLGDRDLATHAIRTQRLRHGDTLSAITADLCRALGVEARILPMSDDPVRTIVHSGERVLPFQDYFVQLRCGVPVTRLSLQGVECARLNPAVAELRGAEAPEAIIIGPSNPFLSIDPILAVPGMRDWIAASGAPVIAVSPIVRGAAIKGPAAKIMQELGMTVSAAGVARHYRGLIAGFVIDEADARLRDEIASEGIAVRVVPTVMRSREDRVQLARDCLTFAEALKAAAPRARP